jgi:hypothetical protein
VDASGGCDEVDESSKLKIAACFSSVKGWEQREQLEGMACMCVVATGAEVVEEEGR